MNIIKVRNKSEISEFHKLVYILYKEQKYWIPHIKQDVEAVFNPQKNSYHQHGKIERFILQKDNLTIGRIAVFYSKKQNSKDTLKTGGFGFFECVNNQKAANSLLRTECVFLSGVRDFAFRNAHSKVGILNAQGCF